MRSIPAETTDICPTCQPSGRYWPFQWYELAIFLEAAVILASFCFWWIRRRVA